MGRQQNRLCYYVNPYVPKIFMSWIPTPIHSSQNNFVEPMEHHGNDWGVEGMQHAEWLNITRALLPHKSWLRVNMLELMLTMMSKSQGRCPNLRETEFLVLQQWEWIPWGGKCVWDFWAARTPFESELCCAEVYVIWLYMENRDEGNERWVKEVSKESISSCWGQTIPWKPTSTVVGTHSFLRIHISEQSSSARSSAEFFINFSLLLNKHQDWYINTMNKLCWTARSHTHYHLCGSIWSWPLTVPHAA